jgi:hypothetical protein
MNGGLGDQGQTRPRSAWHSAADSEFTSSL